MNNDQLYTKNELFEKLIVILKNYDVNTLTHCLRVALYTSLLLKYLKEEDKLTVDVNNDEYLKDIIYAAAIHDIGKIYVNPRIIIDGEIKSDKDIEEIKEHTKIGTLFFKKQDFKTIYEGILYHHERYDGKGYPIGLKDQEISFVGKIINLTDSFDAMTTKRPYMTSAKKPLEGIVEIKECLGTQFDPYLGENFVNMFNLEKYREYLESEKDSLFVKESLKKMLDWLYSDDLDITNIFD